MFQWRKWIAVAGLLLAGLLAAGILTSGCGGSSQEAEHDSYVSSYVKTMDEFQARASRDDKEFASLAQKNDLSGLINLDKKRITDIQDVYGQIMKLRPSADLQKVHAITLYYLVSVVDQLQAQNNYWEAVLSSKPSTDLKTIAESATTKVQALAAELGVELQKANIKLKSMQQRPSGQQQTSPATPSGGSESAP